MKKILTLAAIAAAAVCTFVAAYASDDEPQEKTVNVVRISDAGIAKLQVVKLVKEYTGLGLKDAKEIVDSIPSVVPYSENFDAKELADALTAAGATVSIEEATWAPAPEEEEAPEE